MQLPHPTTSTPSAEQTDSQRSIKNLPRKHVGVWLCLGACRTMVAIIGADEESDDRQDQAAIRPVEPRRQD